MSAATAVVGNRLFEITANRLKAGDRLIRREDHLGRQNHSVEITAKDGHGVVQLKGYWRDWETTKSLAAQGYRVVERNGVEIGSFFQRYW